MENTVMQIQELLNRRAELQARLNLLPYDGTPEIKTISGRKYLYVRKRELDKVKSTYVGEYSEELYSTLLRNNVETKSLRKEIRQLEKQLAILGYKEEEFMKKINPKIIWSRS